MLYYEVLCCTVQHYFQLSVCTLFGWETDWQYFHVCRCLVTWVDMKLTETQKYCKMMPDFMTCTGHDNIICPLWKMRVLFLMTETGLLTFTVILKWKFFNFQAILYTLLAVQVCSLLLPLESEPPFVVPVVWPKHH